MTQKQKVLAGVMTLIIVLLFGFLYAYFSMPSAAPDANTAVTPQTNAPATAVVPATPDAAVDAIIKDASVDTQALQTDAASEKDAVKASGQKLNTLSQTYDENKL